MELLSDRIKKIRKTFGLSQDKLATIMGTSLGVPKGLEQGKTKHIKDKYVIILANEFGLNKEWIETGKGDFRMNQYDLLLDETSIISDALESYGTKIPYYQDRFEDENVKYISLPPEIMQFKNKVTRAIKIKDDSMSDTIVNGDVIFIDKSSSKIQNGKIFYVQIQNELSLKRLFINPSSEKIILKSNNLLFPQLDLLEKEFTIIGKAIANMKIKEL